MFHKKTLVTLAVMGLILSAGIATSLAAETNGQGVLQRDRVFDQADRDAINQAVLAGDYQTWLSLVGDNPITEKITQDNFSTFQAMHQALAEARSLAEELGLPERGGMMGNFGDKGGQNNQAVQDAILAGDYQTWLSLVGDNPITEKITQDNFSTFQAMHQALADKDFETAKSLADDLGLSEMGQGKRMGMNEGMHMMQHNQLTQDNN